MRCAACTWRYALVLAAVAAAVSTPSFVQRASAQSAAPTNVTYTIGVLFDRLSLNTQPDLLAGFVAGFDFVNSQQLLTPTAAPGTTAPRVFLNFTRQNVGSTATNVTAAMDRLLLLGCTLVIGPAGDPALADTARYANLNSVVFIAPYSSALNSGATSPVIYYSDKRNTARAYRRMVRPAAPKGHGGFPVVPLLRYLNWTGVTALNEGSLATASNSIAWISAVSTATGYRVRATTTYTAETPTADWTLIQTRLLQLQSAGARVIICAMDETPLTSDLDAIRTAAISSGMYGNGYTWVFTWEAYDAMLWLANATNVAWPGAIFLRRTQLNPDNPFRQAATALWARYNTSAGFGPVPSANAQNAFDAVVMMAQAMARVQFAGYDPVRPNNTNLVLQALRTRQVVVGGVRKDDSSYDGRYFQELWNGYDTAHPTYQDRLYKTEFVNFQTDPNTGLFAPVVIGSFDPALQWPVQAVTRVVEDFSPLLSRMQWSTTANETSLLSGAQVQLLDGTSAWGGTSIVRGDAATTLFATPQSLQLFVRNSYGDSVKLNAADFRVALFDGTGAQLSVQYTLSEVTYLDVNATLKPTLGSYIVSYMIPSIGLEDPGAYVMKLFIRNQLVTGNAFSVNMDYPPDFLRVGKVIDATPDYTTNVLAAFVAVVGAWAGLSFLDQSLSLGDHAPRFQLAYVLLGASCFGLALWGAMLVSMSSLSLPSHSTFTAATVMGSVCIAVGTSLVLIWVLSRFTRARAEHKVTRLEMHVGMTHSEVENKHVTHRLRSWQAVLSAVLVSGACYSTWALLYSGLDTQSNMRLSEATNVVGAVLSAAMAGAAPVVMFRWFNSPVRMLSPVLYGAAIVMCPYLALTGVEYTFHGDEQVTGPVSGVRWSLLTTRYVGLFTGVAVAVVLVVLNVTKLRLSKDELLRMVKLMRVKLDDTRGQLLAERSNVYELRALMHLTALVRPHATTDHSSLLRYLSVTQKARGAAASGLKAAAGSGPDLGPRFYVNESMFNGSSTVTRTQQSGRSTHAPAKGADTGAVAGGSQKGTTAVLQHRDTSRGKAMANDTARSKGAAPRDSVRDSARGKDSPKVGAIHPALPGALEVFVPPTTGTITPAGPTGPTDDLTGPGPAPGPTAPVAPTSSAPGNMDVLIRVNGGGADSVSASPAAAGAPAMAIVSGSPAAASPELTPVAGPAPVAASATASGQSEEKVRTAAATDPASERGSPSSAATKLYVAGGSGTQSLRRAAAAAAAAGATAGAPNAAGPSTAGAPAGVTGGRNSPSLRGSPMGVVVKGTSGMPWRTSDATGGDHSPVLSHATGHGHVHGASSKAKVFDFDALGLVDTPAVPDLHGVRLELDEVLNHPVCLELLKDQMAKNHTAESMLFFLEVQAWKMLDVPAHSGDVDGDADADAPHAAPDPNAAAVARAVSAAHLLRVRMAQHIARRYIADGAPFEINIEANMRQAILGALEKGTAGVGTTAGPGTGTARLPSRAAAPELPSNLFATAEAEVFKLIRTNDLPRLADSEAGLVCKALLRSRPVAGVLSDRNELFALPSAVTDSVRRHFLAAGGHDSGGHATEGSLVTASMGSPRADAGDSSDTEGSGSDRGSDRGSARTSGRAAAAAAARLSTTAAASTARGVETGRRSAYAVDSPGGGARASAPAGAKHLQLTTAVIGATPRSPGAGASASPNAAGFTARSA